MDEEVGSPDGRPVLTVGEINRRVRRLIEADEELDDIWLKGEVSNYSGPHHSSGHLYFRLKDDEAEIDCVMWSRNVQAMEMSPEDGMAVLARGSAGLYEKQGRYQFYVEQMLEAGRGDLYLRYQMLKRELEEEGLFDPERKREIPGFPRTIGVVTSRGAAAFQDVVNVLGRRSPHVRVLLSDARVQGEGAGTTIARAIERLDERAREVGDVDVILLTRGGGSIEDLWAFNEEVAVRAVAASRLPVISGVGHETDTTLVDLAADARAPTPSAAAELAAPSREETLDVLEGHEQRLAHRATQTVRFQRNRLTALASRPVLSRPEALLAEAWQRTDDLSSRLPRAMGRRLERARARLDGLAARSVLRRPDALLREAEQALVDLGARLPRAVDRRLEQAGNRLGRTAGRLDALSPLKVLGRGYAVATSDGRTVRSIEEVGAGDEVDVRVRDGSILTEVLETEEAPD